MRRLASLVTVALLAATVSPLLACAGAGTAPSAMACCQKSRRCAAPMTASAENCCAAPVVLPDSPAVAPESQSSPSRLGVLAAATALFAPPLAHDADAPSGVAAVSPPASGPPAPAPLRV